LMMPVLLLLLLSVMQSLCNYMILKNATEKGKSKWRRVA